MNDKNRKIAIIVAAILGCVGLFYLDGMLGQVLGNYAAWMDSGGVSGESTMKPVSWNPLICFPAAFSGNGIKGILMILLIAGAIFAYVKLHDKFDGKQHDPRGFARSKSGIYGTASWMDEKEMKEVLEISPVPDAKGTILGEYNGKAVCMPEDTRLNRHFRRIRYHEVACDYPKCAVSGAAAQRVRNRDRQQGRALCRYLGNVPKRGLRCEDL